MMVFHQVGKYFRIFRYPGTRYPDVYDATALSRSPGNGRLGPRRSSCDWAPTTAATSPWRSKCPTGRPTPRTSKSPLQTSESRRNMRRAAGHIFSMMDSDSQARLMRRSFLLSKDFHRCDRSLPQEARLLAERYGTRNRPRWEGEVYEVDSKGAPKRAFRYDRPSRM